MRHENPEIMIFVLIGVLFLNISPVYAEIVVFKSGKTVEGKLIEKTDKYIKIDFLHGTPLTYFFDDIESIDGVHLSKDANALKEEKKLTKNKFKEETSAAKQERQKIEDMLHAFFTYECNFVYDRRKINESAYGEDYEKDNPEIEKARALIDWDSFEVEPRRGFQLMYKKLSDDRLKMIMQRNMLMAKFASLRMNHTKAGLPHRIEDYQIKKVNMDDSLLDAEVIYSNALGENKLRVHKKYGVWLICRDYYVK